jgi:hypothetical protein
MAKKKARASRGRTKKAAKSRMVPRTRKAAKSRKATSRKAAKSRKSARSAKASRPTSAARTSRTTRARSAGRKPLAAPADHEALVDGCDLDFSTDVTPDSALPAAKGGVEVVS